MTIPTDAPPKRRPMLALLVDYLGGDYQAGLVSAISRATQRLDYDLLIVVGRSLNAPDESARAQNEIYGHLGPPLLDGIVAGSGCMGIYTKPEELAAFCQQWAGLPVSSISTQLPEIPSLVVSNRRGQQLVVDHLIEEHQCQHIAYIRGPLASEEAEERFAGYCASLERHGIAFDPGLVETGNFWVDKGAQAMQNLLDRGAVFDAVVAANDYMALGAMQTLKSRGIRIPHTVRVTGFDDAPAAVLASPSLTTVRQPLQQLGALAVESVRDQMNGESSALRQELDVDLVPRQSCGCGYRIRISRSSVSYRRLTQPVLVELTRHRRELAHRLSTAAEIPPGSIPGWTERLLSALAEELQGKNGRFLLELEDLLDEAQPDSLLVERFYLVISALRSELAGLSTEGSSIELLDDVWHASVLLVSDATRRSHLSARRNATDAFETIRASIERLSSALSHSALSSALIDVFERTSIRSAALSLYTDESRTTLTPIVVHGRALTPETASTPFPTSQLAPLGFFDTVEASSHIVFPITFGSEHLGIAVLQGGMHSFVYTMLREHMGAALKTAALHRSVVQQTALRERAEREQLQKETEIAQQIQTEVLPQEFQVPGLQIAARMLPAASVGGDYYDVLPTAEGAWIGFGDVTGHGLLSGLIMLMIQSMVKSAVSLEPQAQPSALVIALNRALYDNIRFRLKRDEHATFTLIRFEAGGKLTFAGAHEEILICRKRTGRCERLQTPGIWLGTLPDVSQLTCDDETTLETGDLMVLYSDGITESLSSSREQFGVERVMSIIEQCQAKPVDEICDYVLGKAQAWTASQLDDMTILAARYVGP